MENNRYSQQILDALNELIRRDVRFEEKLSQILQLNTSLLADTASQMRDANKNLGFISNSIGDYVPKEKTETNTENNGEIISAIANNTTIISKSIIDFSNALYAKLDESILLSKERGIQLKNILMTIRGGFAATSMSSMVGDVPGNSSFTLRSVVNMDTAQMLTKLQSVYNKAKDKGKQVNSDSSAQGGEGANTAKMVESMKGLATFITDFVKAAIEFSKNVKGKLDPEDIPLYITKMYTEISKNISEKDIEHGAGVFAKVSGLMDGISKFSNGISTKVFPSLLFAYHLGLGKIFAKLVKQISKELKDIKRLPDEIDDTLGLATDIIDKFSSFSMDIGKVYGSLIMATAFPIGKLYAFLIKSTVKSLSSINKKITKESFEYVANGVSVINSVSDLAGKLRETNQKILAVIFLQIGNRAAFMIKSIVNSLSKIKPITKEGLASIQFTKTLITEDLIQISKGALVANMFLTVFSKTGFGKKLGSLFTSVVSAVGIIGSSKILMNDKSRNTIFAVLDGISSKLLKFITEMQLVNKKIGSVKDQEKYNEKLEKLKLSVGKVSDMLIEIADNKVVITGATHNLEQINGAVRGISGMIMSLAILTPLIPLAAIGLTFVASVLNIFKLIGALAKPIKRGAHALKDMGGALVLFSAGALWFSLTMVKIVPQFLAGMAVLGLTAYTFFIIGGGSQLIKRGAKAVTWMGIAMTSFAIGAFFLGAAVSSNPIGIMAGVAVLGLTAMAFFVMGMDKVKDKIAMGALLTLGMSISLFFFAGALTFLGLSLKLWSWDSVLMNFALLGGTAILFGLIGKFGKKTIGEGALGVTLMGVSLIAFSLGVAAYGLSIKLWNWESLAMGMVLLGGLATIYTLAGKFGKQALMGSAIVAAMGASLILLGIGTNLYGRAIKQYTWESVGMSLALIGGLVAVLGVAGAFGATAFLGSAIVAAMGLALIPFSLGLFALSKVPKFTNEQIIGITEIIGALTLGFSALGLASMFILPGSIAAISMGAGLVAISHGLKSTQDLNWSRIPIADIKRVIVGLAEAFAAVGAENAGGVMGSLVKAMSFGLVGPNKVRDGIRSVLNASKALTSVAIGVKNFDEYTSGLNLSTIKENGKNVPAPGSVPHRISTVLGMINKAFADIGASGNKGFSLMKVVFGSDFKQSDTEVGIKAVMKAGKALTGIAQGVKDFSDMTDSLNFSTIGNGFPGTPAPGSVPHRIATILGVINKVFADIGASGNSGFSLTKVIFGSDFKQSDTEVGIDSVKNAGKALSGIAQGVKDFDQFTQDMNFNPNDPEAIQNKITKILGTISAVFAGIAQKNSGGSVGGSFLNMLTGINLDKNDVEKGIDSVKNVGKVFSDIAEGLKVWNNLQAAGINMVAVTKSVTSVLTSISDVFAKIGEKDKGGLFSEGNVTNGIDAVKGVGEVFKGIASGVKVFADLQKMGFPADAFDPNKKGSISWNMKEITLATADVFAKIGSGDYFDADGVQKGIEAVSGVGKEFESIAKGVKSFGELKKNGIDINTVQKNIKSVVLTIAQVFGEIGANDVSIKRAATGIKAISGVGKELEAISKSLQPYADLQKGEHKINVPKLKQNIKELIAANIEAVANVGKEFGNGALVTQGKDAIKAAVEGLNPITDIINKFKAFKVEEWKTAKTIMKESVEEPFNIFQDVFNSWSKISGNWDVFMNKGINGIRTQLGNLTDSYSNAKKSMNGLDTKNTSSQVRDMLNMYSTVLTSWSSWKFPGNFNDLITIKLPTIENKILDTSSKYSMIARNLSGLVMGTNSSIQLLTGDMETFMKMVDRTDIKKSKLGQFDGVVKYLERLAWINDPFKKFADRFRDHVNDMKSYLKEINNIKQTPFQQFLDLNSKAVDLIKSDSSKLANNLKVLQDYLVAIKQTGEAYNPMAYQQQPQMAYGGYGGGNGGGGGNSAFTQQVAQKIFAIGDAVWNTMVASQNIEKLLTSIIEGGVVKVNDIET